ncbi:TPA: hypothetical protein PXN82_004389 [Yersinia enterocolitica]|nr:hypothetical protein [Yersinia enterocolitica]HDL7472546.1 hypothetical protein [Yersinia enterocolitica]HDL7490215.1 hypothetical protein [Yersinia enterocolitica]HDL7493694.1 hypothetical protein [Yersinia enterocolitica]
MGELSKYVGEVGEGIGKTFFDIIGWKFSFENDSIVCMKKEKHARGKTKQRLTHGIDRAFSYISKVESQTIQNVFISCKNTFDKYPANPVTKFKEHIDDLIIGMECFKYSQIRKDLVSIHSGISNSNDVGLLFWISCHEDTYDNVIEKVKNCRIESDYQYGTLYIVDNSTINFHIKSIDHINKKFKDYVWSYYIPETSVSYGDNTITKRTKILPIEFINTPFLYFVLDSKINKQEQPKFLIITKDSFDETTLSLYVNAARQLTNELTNDFIFAFPDFNSLKDQSVVSKIKMMQPEDLPIEISVTNYNNQGVRELYDGK